MVDPLLLVVEGPDDKHVIWALLERHRFLPEFVVRDEGGYEKLMLRLPQRLKPGSDLERFGVVVDADADVATRWQSIKSVLDRAGYANVPDRPDPLGTILHDEILPRLGLWIMPTNTVAGMLEDYLTLLIPTDDPLLDLANRTPDAIPAENRRFIEAHRPKALIHTWLAWQEDPGTPMGQAVTKRYLVTDGPHVAAFLAWLTRLFA